MYLRAQIRIELTPKFQVHMYKIVRTIKEAFVKTLSKDWRWESLVDCFQTISFQAAFHIVTIHAFSINEAQTTKI